MMYMELDLLTVVKFGGSSLATASAIIKAISIIRACRKRRLVVASAPGRGGRFNTKITDILIRAHEELKESDTSIALENFRNRFITIASDLGLDKTDIIEKCIKSIKRNRLNRDYVISRGEYLISQILATKLGYHFIDARDYIVIKKDGRVNERSTKKRFKLLCRDKIKTGIVMGGFYGECKDGIVKTFARGGGDYTGAIASAMLGADMYENFTDTNGVRTEDPRKNPNAELIAEIPHADMHKMSLNGASVIFPDCMPLLEKHGIPIKIDNTFNPDKEYTIIKSAT